MSVVVGRGGVSLLRVVVFVAVVSVLAAVLGSPAAVAGDSGESGDPTPAGLVWADWASGAGGVAAGEVRVTAGGVGVLGLSVFAGSQQVPDPVVVFSAVPQWLTLRPVDLPGFVERKSGARLSGCSRSGDQVRCSLPDSVGSGTEVVSAVGFRAARSAPAGKVELSASLQSAADGSSDAVSDAVWPVSVKVGQWSAPVVAVRAAGLGAIAPGERAQRLVVGYSMGGSVSPARGVRVARVLPQRLAAGAKFRGQKWSCAAAGAGSCSWSGRLRAGMSTSALVVSLRPGRQARRGVKASGSVFPVSWSSPVSVKARRGWVRGVVVDQSASLLGPQAKNPTAQFKSAQAALAAHGVRVARLNVSGMAHNEQRLGGVVRYSFTVNNGGSVAAKGARVRLLPPAHARVVRATGAGWRCQVKSGGCVRKNAIAGHEGAPPIEVLVKSDPGKARKVNPNATGGKHAPGRMQAMVTWPGATAPTKNNTKSRNNKKGKQGEQGSKGTRVSAASKGSTSRVAIDQAWLPLVRVQLHSTNQTVFSGSDASTVLSATVAGSAGGQWSWRIKQICNRDAYCPKVNWHGPVSGSTTEEVAAVGFSPPQIKRQTQLRFRVDGRSAGHEFSDTVAVRAHPMKPIPTKVQWNPRLATTTPNPASLEHDSDPFARDRGMRPHPVVRVRHKPGPAVRVRAGQKVQLRVHAKPLVSAKRARVLGTAWRLDGRRLAAGKRAMQVVVPIPKRHPGGLAVARIDLRHPHRVTTVRTSLLRIVPRGGNHASGSSAVRVAPRASSTESFCSLFQEAVSGTVAPVSIDSLSLDLGTVTVSGSGCSASGAAVAFTGGSVTVNGIGFSQLSGSITTTGLTINAGKVLLPGVSSATGLSGSITAEWGGSGLTSLSVSLSVSQLPWLPLPTGWSVTKGTLTISGGGTNPYQAVVDVAAIGANQAAANLSADIAADGSLSASVGLSNALMLTASNGSSAVFAGKGTLARSAAGTWSGSVTAGLQVPTGATSFPLFDNLSLSSASLTWDQTGLSLSAAATITVDGTEVPFTVAGQISDVDNWSVTVSSTASFTVSAGQGAASLTVANPSGTFGMSDGQVVFAASVDITGQAAGAFVGIDVTSGTASITNACPSSATSCSPTAISLDLNLTGTVDIFGETITINPVVAVDLATGTYEAQVTFGGAGKDFGPAEAQLSDVSFFVTNDAGNDPLTKGSVCLPASYQAGDPLVGFTATANFLGDISVTVTGVYQEGASGTASGYCMAGSFATEGTFAQYLGTDVSVIYSTYSINPSGSNPVAPNTLTVQGTWTLPTQVQQYLGNDVQSLVVSLEFTDNAGTIGVTASGQVDVNIMLFGSSGSTNVTLRQVGARFTGTWGGGKEALEFDVFAEADFNTPASSDGTMSAATVPMDFSIGIGEDDTGGYIAVAAQTVNQAPVDNAFGWDGFDLDGFAISAHVGFDALLNSTFSFAAAIQTPPAGSGSSFGSFTQDLGVAPGTKMSLAFSLGAGDTCLGFSIGDQNTPQVNAIDWAGIIKASYVNVVVSPTGGCTVGTVSYKGNFVLDFDGAILGTPVTINAEVTVTPFFSCNISVDVAAFNLAGMAVQQTTLNIVVTPESGQMKVAFSGGANLWGALTIDVSGDLEVNLIPTANEPVLSFDLNGSVDASLFGVVSAGAAFSIDVVLGENNTWINTLDISISGDIKVLIIEASASLALDYSNGAIQSLSGSITVELDWYVGYLKGWVSFAYSAGDADLSITIGGSLHVDLWITSFTITISKTITIDASFMKSSEYKPVPTQSFITNPDNTPNNWEWTSQMWQGSGPNLTAFINSAPSLFPDLSVEVADQYGFGGAMGYSRGTADQITVTPVGGQSNIGQTPTAAGNTYNTITVSVQPGNSPLGQLVASQGQATDGCSSASFDLTVQIPAVNNPAPGDWAYVMMEVNWRLYLATLIEQSNLAWQEEYWVDQGYALNWGDGSAPQGQWVPGDGLPIGSDSSGRPSFPMTYGMTWDCGYGAAFGSGAPSLMDYFSGVYQIQPTLPDSSDMIYLNPGWGDGWNPAGQTMTAGGSMSGTNNQFMAYQGNTLRMQDDGNFVLYPSSGGVQWASNTQGNPGAHLDMQDDCNLVIYGSSGAIWSSNTGGYSGQQCVATLSSTTRSSGINLYVYNITTGTVLFDSSQVNWNSGMTPTQTSQGNNPYQYDLSY